MRRHDNDIEMSTGRPWANLLARICAHLTLVLACVLAVIFVCDLYTRGGMLLLNNALTRYMLAGLCVLAILSTLMQIKSLARLRSLRKYFKLKGMK